FDADGEDQRTGKLDRIAIELSAGDALSLFFSLLDRCRASDTGAHVEPGAQCEDQDTTAGRHENQVLSKRFSRCWKKCTRAARCPPSVDTSMRSMRAERIRWRISSLRLRAAAAKAKRVLRLAVSSSMRWPVSASWTSTRPALGSSCSRRSAIRT